VALYQSGDVDYLIATDAIGMGLNLDVDHVAFAQNRKFDGFQYRQLTAAELGQIAGRAGRHLRDGTFGVTGRVDPFEEDLIQKIEGHDFEPVKVLQWRTATFDFSNLDALKRSIETNAPVEGLTRALPAVDAQALEHLSRDEEIRALAASRERVALLWEACALPDYRRIAPAQHADLVASIYMDLAKRGHVDENYMAEQVRRADTTEGDIDTLSHRIAQIRTWTFVSNRPGWLADQAHWQEKTREIEDRLSDALHERLTKRFVDRRTSVLMRRLRENTMPEAEINPTGTVLVEGHHVGELQGFRFTADQSVGGEDAKAVKAAAQKALGAEFEARAERFSASGNGDIALGSDGTLRWIGAPIGTLVAGEDTLKPRLVLLADEQLSGPARDKVVARAERFVNFQIELLLKPLVELKNAEQVSGIARGIAFQLVENFGLINRRDIAGEMKTLDQEGRAALRRLGVRFGAYHVFVPSLVKPAPAGLITLLWALKHDGKDRPGFGDVVHALASGRTSVVIDPTFDPAFYRLAGYRNLGRRAVRVDILERLADLIRPATNWKPGLGPRPDGAYDGHAFMVTPPMMSILGANADDMEEILKGLGYRAEPKSVAEVKARLEAQDQAAREAAEAKLAAEEAAAMEADASAGLVTEEAERPAEEAPSSDFAAETVAGVDEQPGVQETAQEDGARAAAEAELAEEEAEAMEADATAGLLTAEAEQPAGGGPSAGLALETASGADERPDTRSEAEEERTVAEPVAHAPAEVQPVAASEDTAVAVAAPESKTTDTAAEEEPKPILLWRQARFERPRGNHRHDNRHRGGRNAQAGGEQAGAADNKSEGRGEGKEAGKGRPRFERNRFKGKSGERPQAEGASRSYGKPNREGGRPQGKGAGASGKPGFQGKPREERPARFDPDSPFAKLAALRDQLKK
jgi:ATP-dependent RNA helicase SUPV3L1/SUV3